MKPFITIVFAVVLLLPFEMFSKSVRFVAPYGLSEQLFVATEQGWQPLAYQTNRRGPAFALADGGQIVLSQEGEVDAASGLPTYEVVKQISIESSIEQALCILLPVSRRTETLGSLIINDGSEAFGAGEIRFINALGRMAYFQVDDEYLSLEHLQTGSVLLKDSGYHRILLRAASATERNGNPRVIFSQERMVRNDVRYLVIPIVDAERDIRILWLLDRP